MGLIAKIAIVALVDGQRKEFAPGSDVTGVLSAHDIEVLRGMSALEDTEATRVDRQRHADVAAKADREFQQAREKVKSQQASLTPQASDTQQSGDAQPSGQEGGNAASSGQAPAVSAGATDAGALGTGVQAARGQDGTHTATSNPAPVKSSSAANAAPARQRAAGKKTSPRKA